MACSKLHTAILFSLIATSLDIAAQDISPFLEQGLVQRLENFNPLTYSELINRALDLRNQGEFSEAEAYIRQAHEDAQDRRETYYLLAMTIAFQERFDEAEALLIEALNSYPDNITLLISLARVQSFQTDFALAQSTVEAVLERAPDNTEALNLAGRLAIYQSWPNRAIQRYSDTLAREADNLEALIGMHDAHLMLGERELAADWLARAANQAPDNLDVRTRQQQQQDPQPSWQVIYGYGNSSFERLPLDDWHDGFIEAHRRDGRGNDLYARAENLSHFGMSDTLLAVGTARNLNGDMPWEVKLEYSPDAVFVPDYRISAAVTPRLSEGGDQWGATLGRLSAQFASYPGAQGAQLSVGLDQYLASGRIWLNPSITTVFDENDDRLSGWNLRATMLVGQNNLVGLGYGETPQTENAITAKTRTTHLFGQLGINNQVQLRIDWVREDREDSYLRYGTTLSLIWNYL